MTSVTNSVGGAAGEKEVIENVFNNENVCRNWFFFSKLTNGTFSMLQARSDFCKIRFYFLNTPLFFFTKQAKLKNLKTQKVLISIYLNASFISSNKAQEKRIRQ